MKTKWVIVITAVLIVSLISSIHFYSQMDYLQYIVQKQETRIDHLEGQVDSFKEELKTKGTFSVLAYASWLTIPRNESKAFDVIVQSTGFEGEIEISVQRLPEGVESNLSRKSLFISSTEAGYTALTITVGSNAKAGNYDLVIEGKANNTINFDLVTITIPF